MSATDAPGDAPFGSAAEEAARLFEAVQDWARRASGGTGTGPAGGVPIATGSAECQLCPLCQLLAVLRGSRPETFAHLSDASASLMAALRSAIDAHEREWSARAPSDVERIDIG